ncbi:DUF1684 domain-containing protein [Candidatus Bathyarchaeota archaeon]|nr:DUF1684 domain-containing protein [Candidatus Bathyarchaeota archaeon]
MRLNRPQSLRRRCSSSIIPQSPILQELRSGFRGLDHFPAGPSYSFLCQLNEYRSQVSARMMASTGVERGYRRVGYFGFITLSIPFRDTASGKKSYRTARYLEAEMKDDGAFILAFKRAYNLYGVYTVNYSSHLLTTSRE